MTVLKRRLAEPFFFEQGPTACLLLHGFSGSPAEVRPMGEYLAANGVTVSAPLLPGHGTDPEDLRRTRWPQWIRAAEAELARLQERYGRVHVAGFSMGGLIALYLAAHCEPATVTTLACPIRLADWRQLLVPLAKYFVPYYPARISNPEIAAQLDSYDRFPVATIHSLLHLARQVRKDLPRVSAPLLVVQGERDKWIAEESADFIMANAGSAVKEQLMLPGRNHMVTLEHGREEVFRSVLTWIGQ
ncbi:MAG TPA: alpha/beta fold hydrolase [Symbiobacteriaceae bacterium]|nr:alpha/beta fold hydrolase [Symbiobacteriaceae bacterium]